MMQRAAGVNVRGLSALLVQPTLSMANQTTASTIDTISELERDRACIRETARQEGYAEGMARAQQEIDKGIQEASDQVRRFHAAEQERIKAVGDRMSELLREISHASEAIHVSNEALLPEIVYAAIVRLLGDAAADRNLIQSVCYKALEEYQQRPVVVRVSREDIEQLQELAGDAEITVEADARLTTGQCCLQTRMGDYETSLEVRLEALKQAFLRSLEPGRLSA